MIARIRKTGVGEVLLPLFDDSEGAQLIVNGEKGRQGESTTVIIRYENDDNRAERKFNEKYKQLSAEVANVIVINAGAVRGSVDVWKRHRIYLVQSARNRKVGAVLVYEQGIVGPPEVIRRTWTVIKHSNPLMRLPTEFLESMESLDQSE